jgi:GTP diphosphokinase / guanosine-3',5'-bis(diphosphate) 3'-diphosphatase
VLRQFELLEKIKSYDPNIEETILNKAYVFAMRAHGSQLRASGDPYFSHPVEVAGILADMRFDLNTIITALLHDVVEDTNYKLLDIKKVFGREISILVDGVTKLSKLEGRSDKFNQAENFRKLLLATSDDIRVLLVKLADRLHNMRTIDFIKDKDKRNRIAKETLEIYAPIAERMGMQEIRAELAELCFKVLEPSVRDTIVKRLDLLRSQDDNILKKTISKLQQLLKSNNIESKVFGREKTPYSIWKKMQVKSVNLSQLADILAFKIIVKDSYLCYRVLGILHQVYSYVPGRFKDYISTPKPNGYRSLHTTLIGPMNRRIEVQIKSQVMDEQADFGVAAHWIYKDKVKMKDGKQYKWIRQILDILDQSSEPEEFLEHTKIQMYNDQVFVFSPKGDLISLPKGAMPLDFAFSLHTDVGSTCMGVKINNSIKPLKTPLKNGDQVEIICDNKNTILPEWLNLSITGKAKACIKRFINLKEDEEFRKLGKNILKNTFKNERILFNEKSLSSIFEKLNVNSNEKLYFEIGTGNIIPSDVVSAMFPEKKILSRSNKIILFNKLKTKKEKKPSIMLKGLTPGMSIHYARCCLPIPGDDVVAFTTPGKGLMVHLKVCEELNTKKNSKINFVNVSWDHNEFNQTSFICGLNVEINNEVGSLGELTSVLAESKSNIRNLKITERNIDFFILNIEIDVMNLEHLNKIIVSLRASKYIEHVKRI